MLLPDVNVWHALTFDAHVHHPVAKTWFDGLPNDAVCYFCRITQLGLLRLATNPSVFGKDALTLPEAWRKYDLFLSDPRISFVEEPADIEISWRTYTQSQAFSPKVWNDAYLAAFAVTAGLELVTFDKAFTQYQNLTCKILP
jgi:toxin-antitoxin system PIN domain toxin